MWQFFRFSPLFLFFFISFFSFGEGTKEILLTASGHGKIQVNSGFSDFAWYAANGSSGNANYRLNIHISNIGEKIYYGFGDPLNNNDQTVTDVQYRIKDPTGSIVVGPTALPLTGTGHIETFTQAVNGPSGIVGGTGYSSLSYTPTMTGDFFIEFNFNTGWGGNDRCKFRYFDITVGSVSNQKVNGRVWSKGWQMTADNQAPPSGEYTFWGTLFVYSDDGIVTSVDFNGMEPYVFAVSCNPWGCYNTGIFNDDRRSINGNHTLTQYKIFLNDPDSVAYPTGILGSVVPPITVTPNCTGTAIIDVVVSKSGNLDLLLNINPTPGIQAEDVQLSATVTTGTNAIPWNGLNGLGQPVPNGTTFNIIITYINGLTNLPIYDVEENASGFIIELQRPTGSAPPVFWDDILVGGTQNFDGCTFVPPSTGCHTFSYSVGNNITVNTWWYAVTSVSSPVLFTQLRAPQSLGTINGIPALCPGTTGQHYWVDPEPNSDSTVWSYSGTGATITVLNDFMISIDFTNNATSGTLTVNGYNHSCGTGITSSMLPITIYPSPAVSLTPFTPICIDAPPFPLAGGAPAGGAYSIGGIPVATFDPIAYGTGSHTVTYTYSDGVTGCTASDSEPLVVNPLPTVTLPALSPVCVNLTPITLSGGTPLGGIYSGSGVTGGNLFDPGLAGAGTHEIVYTFTDGSGCTNTDTTSIIVHPLTPVILPPFPDVCINTPPFLLSGGTPLGGTYTGPGIAGGTFNPAIAGIGTTEIIYTYTDGNSCTNMDTNTLTVKPLPDPAGAIIGSTVLCQGSVGIAYTTTPIVNADYFQWELIPGGAGTVVGNSATVSINWNASFTGSVTLTVKGVNSCGDGLSSLPLALTVNPNPIVSFTRCFDSVTLTTAQPIHLKGGVPFNGTYSGTGVSGGILTPSFAGSGLLTLTYSYTNNEGCEGHATQTITIQTPVPWNCGSTLTDPRDSKQYNTILIGSQCWMASNLNYGTQITSTLSQRDNCIPEKYCFNDSPALCALGSALYQWDEVMQYSSDQAVQGFCPPGWHIPTEAEWLLLFNQFTSNGFAGNALKYTGYSGFNALMTGFLAFNQSWKYPFPDAVLRSTIFWSSTSRGPTKAWAHGMNEVAANDDFTPSVSFYPAYRLNAFAVRCVYP